MELTRPHHVGRMSNEPKAKSPWSGSHPTQAGHVDRQKSTLLNPHVTDTINQANKYLDQELAYLLYKATFEIFHFLG